MTLDDLVDEARQKGVELVASTFTSPVLLVDAPAEGWADNTAVRTGGGEQKHGSQMLPTLVVKVMATKPTTTPNKLTLGRSAACDIVLPFAALSKVHAGLTLMPGENAQIEDLGSTNGSTVEGTKLAKAARASLVDGTRIRFGDVHATFYGPRSFGMMLRHKSK